MPVDGSNVIVVVGCGGVIGVFNGIGGVGTSDVLRAERRWEYGCEDVEGCAYKSVSA